jgi:hypothetical protein
MIIQPDIPNTHSIQTGNNNVKYLTKQQESDTTMEDNFEIVEPDYIKNMLIPNNELSTVKKYNIIDLFLLFNDDIITNPNLVNNKTAHIISISYNIDFGNIKLTYFQLTNDAIDNHVIFKNNLKLLISGTIYPSSAYRINNSSEENIICMEQLITNTNEQWQKDRPCVNVIKDKVNKAYIVNINDCTYTFKGWQLKCFKESLEYIYKDGFNLRGNLCLKS